MATATASSTPTLAPRPCCGFCPRPSSHARKAVDGTVYRSCADHQTDMEIMVREINEWDGERVLP